MQIRMPEASIYAITRFRFSVTSFIDQQQSDFHFATTRDALPAQDSSM